MVGETQNAFEVANSTGLPGSEGQGGGSAPQATPGSTPGVPGASAPETVEIKWNGKVERVPLTQAIELAQKGYDYTQKMQDLARQRESFGTERQRYEQAIGEVRAFLQDRNRVRQYLQQLEGGQGQGQATGTPDAEAVITQQELEARIAAARQEMQGLTNQQMEQMRLQLQTETLASQYARDLDGYIDGLKKSIPELRAIPKVDLLLKQEVRAMGPRGIEEAKQMMRDVAQEQARQVRSFLEAERKAGAGQAGAQGPLANGIEPKGGGQAMPQAPSRKFKGLNDPDFKAAVLHDIQFGPGPAR